MDEIFGVGNYTIKESEALTGIPAHKINRWVFGGKSSKPLLIADFPKKEEGKYRIISFNNLIECLFVNAFVNKGISLNSIREIIEKSKHIDSRHPFCYEGFYNTGRGIIEEVVTPKLKYRNSNGEFSKMTKSLWKEIYKGIFFENKGKKPIDYWQPSEKCPHIVVNPKVQFGAPTVKGRRLFPETIYFAYMGNPESDKINKKYLNAVAEDYNVEPHIARECLNFGKIYKFAS